MFICYADSFKNDCIPTARKARWPKVDKGGGAMNIRKKQRSGVMHVCFSVTRIRIYPIRRDARSGVLIGARGTRRSDWSARV